MLLTTGQTKISIFLFSSQIFIFHVFVAFSSKTLYT